MSLTQAEKKVKKKWKKWKKVKKRKKMGHGEDFLEKSKMVSVWYPFSSKFPASRFLSSFSFVTILASYIITISG